MNDVKAHSPTEEEIASVIKNNPKMLIEAIQNSMKVNGPLWWVVKMILKDYCDKNSLRI